MSKKVKNNAVNKKTLRRILNYIKKYNILVILFSYLRGNIGCTHALCTDSDRTYGR